MKIDSQTTKMCTELIAEQIAKKRFDRKLLAFTDKQIQTLLLYSQNYTLQFISDKMGVCLTTTRERLRNLSEKHKREFENALRIRQVYKNGRDSIRNTKNFSDLGIKDRENSDSGPRTQIEGISEMTKRTF